ncbi:MAG: hypothetical protein J7M25_04735 [Deltaproteobacteria bacterium]|nr:hypothetical protein [Deltaproteobacteria bacterium]
MKGYRTYNEFEQQELYRMDTLYAEIGDIVDNLFVEGLDARYHRGGGVSGEDEEDEGESRVTETEIW